jgi:hypothetical protein
MTTVALDTPKMGDTHTPYVDAADGALRAAGWWDDEDWMLLGLTGFGFHVVADAGTCPSAPTGYDWTREHTNAMARIGIKSRCFECVGDIEVFESLREEAVTAIKESLDRRTPAIIRTFDWAEFAIVWGYDEADQVFFVMDRSGDPDPILYSNLGKPHGSPMLFAQVFDENNGFDLATAARASLVHAVDSWTGGDGWSSSYGSGYRVGREGYRTLIGAVEQANSDPLGLRYILRILSDARVGIGRYTEKLRSENVLPRFDPVAEKYAEVASVLQRAATLLPAQEPWERPLEPEVLPEASSLLKKAMDLEDAAVRDIELLLA